MATEKVELDSDMERIDMIDIPFLVIVRRGPEVFTVDRRNR